MSLCKPAGVHGYPNTQREPLSMCNHMVWWKQSVVPHYKWFQRAPLPAPAFRTISYPSMVTWESTNRFVLDTFFPIPRNKVCSNFVHMLYLTIISLVKEWVVVGKQISYNPMVLGVTIPTSCTILYPTQSILLFRYRDMWVTSTCFFMLPYMEVMKTGLHPFQIGTWILWPSAKQ